MVKEDTHYAPVGFYLQLLLSPEERTQPPAPHSHEETPFYPQGPPPRNDLGPLPQTPPRPGGREPSVQEEHLSGGQ